MADLQSLVESIKNLTLLEASQLVKTLEEELGVSAAAAGPVMVASAGGGDHDRAGGGRGHAQLFFQGLHQLGSFEQGQVLDGFHQRLQISHSVSPQTLDSKFCRHTSLQTCWP